MMTEMERKKFLKSMGYSGNCMYKTVEPKPGEKKVEKVDTRVDKSELLALHKIFNQKKEVNEEEKEVNEEKEVKEEKVEKVEREEKEEREEIK